MVPLVEATRFRKKTNLADTGQPEVLVNLVMLARSFMTPARKPKPSSGLTVLPDKRGKEKAVQKIAPLPEEEKEKEKARKVRDQVQTDRMAAEEAKAAAVQKVRTDLAEKAEKESVGLPLPRAVVRVHTIILLQPMGEAPLHLANP